MEVTEWEIFSIFLFASSLWSIYLNNYSVAPAAKSLQLCPTLCAPWTAAYQASPSMGFSRQEHWSGLLFPSPTLLLQLSNHTLWSISMSNWVVFYLSLYFLNLAELLALGFCSVSVSETNIWTARILCSILVYHQIHPFQFLAINFVFLDALARWRIFWIFCVIQIVANKSLQIYI